MTDQNHSPADIPENSPEQPSTDSGQNLLRIVIVMIVLLVLVNVPFSYYGAGLAQLKPDRSAIVVENGMLLQSFDDETIYVVADDYTLRPVQDRDVFRRRFPHSHIEMVEADFLGQFAMGEPIYNVVTCDADPNYYVIQDGKRHLLQTSLEAHRDWTHQVSCAYIHSRPLGPPITDETVSGL